MGRSSAEVDRRMLEIRPAFRASSQGHPPLVQYRIGCPRWIGLTCSGRSSRPSNCRAHAPFGRKLPSYPRNNKFPTVLLPSKSPLQRVWNLAEQALRAAERAIIVGYSLPDDDLDVIYLLKRGLGELSKRSPNDITVVELAGDPAMQDIARHPVGRRYRSIFGPDIDWRIDGFEGLVAGLSSSAN